MEECSFNEQNILTHAGKVSAELAKEHAEAQFEQYETQRRAFEAANPPSDFDRFLAETKQLPPLHPRGERESK